MNMTMTEDEDNDVSKCHGRFFDAKHEVLANQMRHVCRISRKIPN